MPAQFQNTKRHTQMHIMLSFLASAFVVRAGKVVSAWGVSSVCATLGASFDPLVIMSVARINIQTNLPSPGSANPDGRAASTDLRNQIQAALTLQLKNNKHLLCVPSATFFDQHL